MPRATRANPIVRYEPYPSQAPNTIPDHDHLASFTLKQLRTLCKENGIKVAGNKKADHINALDARRNAVEEDDASNHNPNPPNTAQGVDPDQLVAVMLPMIMAAVESRWGPPPNSEAQQTPAPTQNHVIKRVTTYLY